MNAVMRGGRTGGRSVCPLLVAALALFAAQGQAVTFTTDTTITSLQYMGEHIIVQGCTLTIDCSSAKGHYASITLQSAVLTHPPGSANGLWLDIAGNVSIDYWSKIDVTGRGHPGGTGPGVGSVPGAGGTYGGTGQGSTTPVYGSYSAPHDFGSGGAARPGYAGGAGGGLINITCGGIFDNTGNIWANGANALAAGAGSGGTVSIVCDTYAGGGQIYADGGHVDTTGVPGDVIAGGGGGGRVSLRYATKTNTGGVYCRGGWGVNKGSTYHGGPGTRYWKQSGSSTADLDFWNDGRHGYTFQPALNVPDVNLTIVSAQIEFDCTAQPLRVNTLTLNSALITHPAGNENGLQIITTGNMVVNYWSVINVDGRGYPADTGPGTGTAPGAGGTYGGTGQGSTAPVNGSWAAPRELGSGGASRGADVGGAGGGRIELTVGGKLTLTGELRARGANALRAGAGSGGAIYVTCGSIESNGWMVADGGNVDATGLPTDAVAGGGGGGRIAIHYGTSTYGNSMMCRGGWGTINTAGGHGGPGTRYWKQSGSSTADLDFWNDGRHGYTFQPALNVPDVNLTIVSAQIEFDCTAQPLRVKTLTLNSALITHPAGNENGLQIITTGNMVVDYWSAINTDGRGYPADTGPGTGTAPGAGGTYGGTGQGSTAPVNGSWAAPRELGSGGASRGSDVGGAGGGRIELTVGGKLTLTGELRARGANALRAGAGSGGAIYITCGSIEDNGWMVADGGDVDATGLPADAVAGGGGGGRIAIHYGTSTYGNSMMCRGGYGVVNNAGYHGGPGTRYWQDNGVGTKSLDFWNDGRHGYTFQPALNVPDVNLRIVSAQIEFNCTAQPLTAKMLSIVSSTITHPAGNPAGLDIVTVGNMDLDYWSSINVDGRGYGPSSGPGAGTIAGSGASHGGTGQGSDVAVCGSFSNPTLLGSGGVNNGANLGGSGGGRIQLTVGGTLTLTGALRASGTNAYWAGGGSGGSILVNCGVLQGTGYLAADGGSADPTGMDPSLNAGGGGGGRIALLYGSSTFTGPIYNRGGWGYANGAGAHAGPGTRYWEDFGAPSKTLEFNNESRDGWTRQPALSIPDVDVRLYGSRLEIDCTRNRMAVRSLSLSGSILTHPVASPEGLQVIADGAVTLDYWSYITVVGRGLPPETGPGRGTQGQGGGYGGAGGYNTLTYGAREMPLLLGSGGGNGNGGTGGAGAGRVSLITAGTIDLTGSIHAYGANSPQGGGGGSGGSVLLVANNVTGGGVIYAYGGNGNQKDVAVGGGGGGRVAIYTNPGQPWQPGGGIQVHGGWGNQNGGAGTIFHGDTVAGTDLQLTEDFKWEWLSDGSGQGSVTVFNVGNQGCGSFKVAIYDRDPAIPGSVMLNSQTVLSLGAFDGAIVAFAVAAPVPTDTLWVKVDHENSVTETNELNNVRFFTIPRAATKMNVPDRTGTQSELVTLRGYLYKTAGSVPLENKTLEFRIDGSFLGTAVTGSSGRADYNWIITDGPITRTIGAQFSGDTEYSPSSGTGTLTCQKWTTRMATFDRTQRITGRTELKARLVRSDNVPLYNKPINFYVDGTFVITRPTDTEGYARYPFYDVPDGAGAGTRTILSEWVGNAGYAAISKTATLTVLKALPYIWVQPRSVPQGGVYRLYCYFRRLYDYKPQAGRTLAFSIDGTKITDVVTDDTGVARYNYNTSGLSKGDHTARCTFAGDPWVDSGFGEAGLTVY